MGDERKEDGRDCGEGDREAPTQPLAVCPQRMARRDADAEAVREVRRILGNLDRVAHDKITTLYANAHLTEAAGDYASAAIAKDLADMCAASLHRLGLCLTGAHPN